MSNADTPTTSLADKLAEAEATEHPLRESVAQLEQELDAAVIATDYAAAAKLQRELAKVRPQWADATADVKAVLADIKAIDDEHQQRIAQQQATERHTRLMSRAHDQLTCADEHLIRARAMLGSVRHELHEALAAEERARADRAGALDALVKSGIADARMILDRDRKYGVPHKVIALINGDPLLRAINYGGYV